jgi:hypothetical protein
MIEPTLTKEEALRESAYLAGLKAGWNLGIIRNAQGMRQAQESRDGYLEFIKSQTNGAHDVVQANPNLAKKLSEVWGYLCDTLALNESIYRDNSEYSGDYYVTILYNQKKALTLLSEIKKELGV